MRLIAEQITVQHPAGASPLVDGASLHVDEGEVVALIGPNGSGKSTLARALAGLIPHGGRTGWAVAGGHAAPRVGLVLQDPAAQSIADTVADDVAWAPERLGDAPDDVAHAVSALLDAGGLHELAARSPARLSGGQQQRLATIALIAARVDVLVLDEPTAMLDARSHAGIVEQIRRLCAPRGLVWITQREDELAACDRIIVMDAGHVVWSGATSEYLADPSIAATWGLALPAPTRLAHELGLAVTTDWIPQSVEDLIARIGAARGA